MTKKKDMVFIEKNYINKKAGIIIFYHHLYFYIHLYLNFSTQYFIRNNKFIIIYYHI